MAVSEDVGNIRSFAKYPLLLLSACFAGGIVLADFVLPDARLALALCLFSAVTSALYAGRRAAVFFLAVAFFAAGSVVYLGETRNVGENRIKRIIDEGRIASGEPVELEGVLAGMPEQTFDGLILTVDAESIVYVQQRIPAAGRIRVYAPIRGDLSADEYRQLDLTHGSRVRIACGLEREERNLNPGVLSRKTLLDQQGIDATATVKSPLLIENLGVEFVSPLGVVYRYRSGLIEKFREKFDQPTASVMIASLLGNKHFLDRQTADVFREGGTFHILVISGLHITFIGGLALLFTTLFTKRKLVQFVVAVAFLWAYTLAVGVEVPVVRASVMFTVLLFSHVIYRSGTLLNALGACCLILLVWRPQDVFNPSFHLTFASVTAIVAMAFPLIEKLRAIGNWTPTAETPFPAKVPQWLKRFCETLYWRGETWTYESGRNIWSANLFKSPYLKWFDAGGRQRILAFVFEGLVVSTIVQIWLLPFLIVYFHRLSVASIILNLWVGTVIAVESFSALLALLFSSVSEWLAFPLIKFTEFLNRLLIAVPGVLTDQAWASVRVPVYSGYGKAIYAVYFLPVLLLAFVLNFWKPFAITAGRKLILQRSWFALSCGGLLAVAAMGIILHPFSAPAVDGRLRVDFLDVGQGDSALITFPDGTTMLVDGGGQRSFTEPDNEDDNAISFEPDRPRIGEAVVSEFLWELGYSKIDHLVATHADADHIQGLVDVARNFEVTSIFLNRLNSNDTDFLALANATEQKQIPIVTISAGERFEFGGAAVEVLHPTRSEQPETASENNRSLVLRIAYGNRSFLLTGDIESESEKQLIEKGVNIASDVVKVPHHGSRTSSSSALVESVSAEYAIFSVGKRSIFGHPHPEVLERWRNSGATPLKTGDMGTITFSTDGGDLVVSTFVKQ